MVDETMPQIYAKTGKLTAFVCTNKKRR